MSCKKIVYSEGVWHGRRCSYEAVKDGFCARHQPDVEAKRKAAVAETQRKKWNARMRDEVLRGAAPRLKAALELSLTALSFNGGVTQYRALAKRARDEANSVLAELQERLHRYRD